MIKGLYNSYSSSLYDYSIDVVGLILLSDTWKVWGKSISVRYYFEQYEDECSIVVEGKYVKKFKLDVGHKHFDLATNIETTLVEIFKVLGFNIGFSKYYDAYLVKTNTSSIKELMNNYIKILRTNSIIEDEELINSIIELIVNRLINSEGWKFCNNNYSYLEYDIVYQGGLLLLKINNCIVSKFETSQRNIEIIQNGVVSRLVDYKIDNYGNRCLMKYLSATSLERSRKLYNQQNNKLS